MAGMTVPLFNEQDFDFDNLSSSTSANVTIAKALDVTPYTEGRILVRVHGVDVGTGSDLTLYAYMAAPSNEEPNTDFVFDDQTSDAIAVATVSASAATADLVVANFDANFGSHVRLVLTATKGTGNCNASLSADLALKE